MRIFEFHFNPKQQEDRFFETAVHEPTEEQLPFGALFVAGELTKAVPTQSKFLSDITKTAEKEYYATKAPKSKRAAAKTAQESALKATLRKLNASLQQESKKGNVDWLGNLNVALASLAESGEETWRFVFGKSGTVKVLVARSGKIVDIGKEVEEAKKASESLKTFSNLVAGEISKDEKILVVTKELHDALVKEKILTEIAFFSQEKQFRDLFKSKQKELSSVSGILFVVMLPETDPLKKKNPLMARIPLFMPEIIIPDRVMSHPLTQKVLPFKRQILLGVLLLLVLGMGVLFFHGRDSEEEKALKQATYEIRSMQKQGTGALSQGDNASALSFFEQAKDLASQFPQDKQMSKAWKDLETQISEISTTTPITSVSMIATAPTDSGFAPSRVVVASNATFFFQPGTQQVYVTLLRGEEGSFTETPKAISLGTSIGTGAVFLASPNTLLWYDQKKGLWIEQTLELLSPQFHIDAIQGFEGNLYAFDKTTKQIAKYVGAGTEQSPLPSSSWLSKSTMLPVSSLEEPVLAIDGNIWVADTTTLQRYYTGTYKASVPIAFQLQPTFRMATGPNTQNIYILDPSLKRIIAVNKITQSATEYADSTLSSPEDIAVSRDGSLVYILSGSSLYQVSL